MKKKIDKTILLLMLMPVMALVLLVLLWGVFNTARQHDEEKTELIALSNNMLHDNNKLIWLMHIYTLRHEVSYLEEYLELLYNPETFDKRIERMIEIGLTDAETAEIEKIIETLDLLEEIEANVLGYLEEGKHEQAIDTIFGDEYVDADFFLIDTIQNLISGIESRSAGTTGRLNRQMQTVMLVFSIAHVALTAALYLVFRSNSKLREQEREANEAKSRFLAMMSHEIRTPMNAILGIAEMQMQNDGISAETEDALGRIYESGNLLLNIINDILDLTKIEAGKLEINPIKYDVPSLINDTIQLNRLRFQSKLIDFHLDIDEKTPLNLFGDELRIRQILGNILSNAYKYTGTGKVRMTVVSEYDADAPMQELYTKGVLKKDDVTLVITISDTGQGMTEEQLGTLFDEYTRYNKEANSTTEGVGLGMSITKRLLDLLGGEISVESKIKVGSAFTVRIPQKRVDELVCGAGMSERLNTYRFLSTQIKKRGAMMREFMPYGRVLIVDDVVSNLYVANGLMVPYGLKIDTATGGYEAIDIIKAGNEYDIVFMDHMMPGMDGVETVKNLRKMGYTGNIVALTANAIVGQADVFLNNGFDDYVSKPIDSRELDRVLNTFIRDQKPPEVVAEARRERAALREQAAAQRERDEKERRQAVWQEQTARIEIMESLDENFIYDAENAIEMILGMMTPSGGIKENEIDTYEIVIHGLKSTLHNVGELELSKRAYELELAAKEEDTDKLSEETPAIIKEVQAIIEKKKGKNSGENNGENGGKKG